MTQTEESAYLADAKQAARTIKSEHHLVMFDAKFCEPTTYMALSERGVRELEDIRDRALRRIYGVGGG